MWKIWSPETWYLSLASAFQDFSKWWALFWWDDQHHHLTFLSFRPWWTMKIMTTMITMIKLMIKEMLFSRKTLENTFEQKFWPKKIKKLKKIYKEIIKKNQRHLRKKFSKKERNSPSCLRLHPIFYFWTGSNS